MTLQRADYDPDGARRLLVNVLLRAARDAARGDADALTWLADGGAILADDLDICHPDIVQRWAESPGPTRLSEL